MVKVIKRDFVQISPAEAIEEITVVDRMFWINFKTVYRKVHGTIFKYKNGRYSEVSTLMRSDVRNYFKLPVEK